MYVVEMVALAKKASRQAIEVVVQAADRMEAREIARDEHPGYRPVDSFAV
jgi:hypothetical protein